MNPKLNPSISQDSSGNGADPMISDGALGSELDAAPHSVDPQEAQSDAAEADSLPHRDAFAELEYFDEGDAPEDADPNPQLQAVAEAAALTALIKTSATPLTAAFDLNGPSTEIRRLDEPDEHLEADEPEEQEEPWGELKHSVSEQLGLSGGALLGICEPVFEQICELNRLRRLGQRQGAWDARSIRSQFETMFSQMSAAAQTAKMAEPFAVIDGPLRCAVDVVMTRCGIEWMLPWRPLAARWAQPDRVLLGATTYALRDGRESIVGSLEVLNVCLCFTADLLRPVKGLPPAEQLFKQLSLRLRRPAVTKLCPSAYEGVFTRTIVPPLGRRLKVLVAASLVLLILAAAAAIALNVFYASQMDRSVNLFHQAMERLDHRAGAGGD